MAEWERTNDTKWRDKINAGVDSIITLPFGLETGKPEANSKALAATVGFDNATGKLTAIPNPQTGLLTDANYNLATIQGGGEVMFELVPLLGRKDFETEWLRLCRLGNAPPAVWTKDKTTGTEGEDASYVPPGQGAADTGQPTVLHAYQDAAMWPTPRKPSPRCSPRALASPTRIWSPAQTRSIPSKKIRACPPTKPPRPACKPSKFLNSARTSSPRKPPSAPSANSAPARLPPAPHPQPHPRRDEMRNL